MIRILYLGSPEEAIKPLEFLLTQKKYQVVGVVTQPAKPYGRKQIPTDPPMAVFAKEKNILCLQPEKAKDKDFLETLKNLDIHIAITCAYGQILSEEFLRIPKRATINIHPSLLPKYRGATPIPATILHDDPHCGVSILFTIKKLDAGSLIISESFPMISGETSDQMTLRLFESSGPLLIQALEKLADPLFVGTPQDESKVVFCPKIQKEDGLISWEDSAYDIERKFRAYYPWPGLYSFLEDGKRVAIHSCSLPETNPPRGLLPGELRLEQKILFLGCTKETVLILNQVCPEGSKAQKGLDFWNGLKDRPKKFKT